MSLTPWRSLIGSWPFPLRQRWADLCEAKESSGVVWPESGLAAFRQIWRETTPADRVIPPVLDRFGRPIAPDPEPTWAELADVFEADVWPAWAAWRAENPTGCKPDRKRKIA